MAVPQESIEEKIKAVIASFCLFPDGEKDVRIKMSDLADLIDETRLNVSNVLNKWNEKGMIELRRYGFKIKDFQSLK